jgi:AcrR family transcriptional regulator
MGAAQLTAGGLPMTRRDTKTLILDAAEALFSESNFDAVPIRDITTKAGVQLALVSYHFKNKEALFEAVIARRAEQLNQDRRAALRQALLKGRPDVEQIIVAFTRPYLEYCIGPDPGWRNYSRLIPYVVQTERWLPLVERHFNATAEVFTDALCEALPDRPRDSVLQAFVFSIQIMVSAFSKNRRIETLSHGKISAADLESAFNVLIPFLSGGFYALPKTPAVGGRAARESR